VLLYLGSGGVGRGGFLGLQSGGEGSGGVLWICGRFSR